MNILDSLKGLVTDELVSKAAGALGEDNGAISNVMQSAIPTVLSGLMGSEFQKSWRTFWPFRTSRSK